MFPEQNTYIFPKLVLQMYVYRTNGRTCSATKTARQAAAATVTRLFSRNARTAAAATPASALGTLPVAYRMAGNVMAVRQV